MHWRDRPKRPKKRTPTSVLAPFIAGYDVPYTDPASIPNRNMGNVQKAPAEWKDHGEGDGLFGPERSEREERVARGKPMNACYRYLLGPTPILPGGDIEGARAFLTKVEKAIEAGGWTRSEATRLRKLRDKWRDRASGRDHRFAVVGNGNVGVTREKQGEINRRRINRELADIINRFKG